MKSNRLHWLEISETIALFIVSLGAVITLFSKNLFFVVVPMVATLILNNINRREREKQIYHRTLGKLEQLQNQVWDELQALHELIEVLQEQDLHEQESIESLEKTLEHKTPPSLNSNSSQIPQNIQEILENYQEYILSLEESLNHVIQYLNQAGINQRFQQLEEYCEQITNDMAHLTRKLNYAQELTDDPEDDSVHLLSFSQENINQQIEEIEAIAPTQINEEDRELANSENASNYQDSTESDPEIIENLELPKVIIPSPESFNHQWVQIQHFSAHENGVTDLVISPDLYFIATISLDQNLKIWSLATGKLLHSTIAHEKGILAISCKQQESENAGIFEYILATGGFDYNIKIWKFTTNQKETFNLVSTHTLTGHLGSIRALKITPNGKLLISGSYDKTVKQWTMDQGHLIQNSYDDLSSIQSIAVSYDSKIIASGGEDGKIYFWEAETGIKRGSLQNNDQAVKSLNLSNNGQLLGAGCSDGTLKLWQLEPSIFREGISPEPTTILSEHSGEIKSIIFSPCGEYLMSADTYGKIVIWSINSAQIIDTLNITTDSEEEQNRLLSLALSQDGNFLVAGDGKGYLTIWQKIVNS
jgi:WD40 repeat protein